VNRCLPILALALLTGCTTVRLTDEEVRVLGHLESLGIRPTEEGTAPPASLALANAWGPLGLVFGPSLGGLPLGGSGNFHLAERLQGEEAETQWWLGVVNACTWPLSPLWSVPQVINDAEVVNQKDTAFFFTRTFTGTRALSLHQARRLRPIPAAPPEDTK